MEQFDWLQQAAFPDWDVLSRVSILASQMQSPIDFFATSNENSTVLQPIDLSWLSCPTADGWGPLSPIYSDLAPCFGQGLLFSGVGLIMVGAGLWQAKELAGRSVSSANRINWSFYAKVMLAALHIVFSSTVFYLYRDPGVIRTGLVLNVTAGLVALLVHVLEQFKSNISRATLLFYWLVQVLFGLSKIVALNLRSELSTQYASVSMLATANAFLLLVLESCFEPQRLTFFKRDLATSPFDRANIFSRISFNWMAPLMKKGYYQYLNEDDLPFLPKAVKAESTSTAFNKEWSSQVNPSLFWALSRAFGAPFVLGGLFKGLQDILAFVQPQLLRLLIIFVNDYSQSLTDAEPLPLTRGLMIAGAMFIVSVMQTTFLHQYFRRAFNLGMDIKSSLTSVIYNKSLVISNETRQASGTGDIVNLMSVDVQRLQDLVQNLQIIWSGPFQIILCLWSLHGLLGNSMWAGVCIMIIMIPLNAFIAKLQKKLQKTQMGYKDERSRLTSEILNNIKSLKLYGWEEPYLKSLNHVRNEKELKNLKKMGVFKAVSLFTWNLAPFLVSCSTFGLFVLLNKSGALSTDIVFPALTLFNLLSFPLAVVPVVITNIVEAQVAVTRLTNFLKSPELQKDAVTKLPRAENIGDVALSIKRGTFLWTTPKAQDTSTIALFDINLESQKGALDCIVGKVGSGKSSLLQALLGDLHKLDGTAKVHGSVAYVSQVPWIFNGTVKENILFGHKYDAQFYQQVLDACALRVDLESLPEKDNTEVGEKGISLSGGQKARLSLARAVYARADVYLLDDPLSSVDEHVGRHLIDNVLGPRGLLRTKCRVLATNTIHVLNIADNIHMIQDGKLVEQGSYGHVMSQEGSKLRLLVLEFGQKNSNAGEPESCVKVANSENEDLETQDAFCSAEDVYVQVESDTISLKSAHLEPLLSDEEALLRQQEDDENGLGPRTRKEHTQQGKVKWNVYFEYAKACGFFNVSVFLFTAAVAMSLNVLSNVWLKHWSEVNTANAQSPNSMKYLGIYFLFGIGYSFSALIQTCVMWIFCTISGSKKLHNGMALSVLRSPLLFFETTPIGRILNRFFSDVYKVDEVLGRVFGVFFTNAVKVLFTILVICFSTWQFIFIAIPLSVLYLYYQQYYLKTSRELRRVDSTTRSPIYANFQESLAGASVIRAYGQEHRFRHLHRSRIDRNMRAYHPSINANRWLAVRLELLGSIIILAASGLAILSLKNGTISAGLIGLSMSYALQITNSLNCIVRMTVEVETNIVSVERIMEYSALPPEAPQVIEDNRPDTAWPERGEIVFKNYSTRYRPELNLALKEVSLAVKSQEKIGIVGRTGAGKSSLAMALFRIIEAENGHIEIDDADTRQFGLTDLRQKLSIIPQNAEIFEGTVRNNLDPTSRYTDAQLWRALELSHLKDHVVKLFEDCDRSASVASALDVKIREGGANLSVGQKQLMCLARAFLIPSAILVLDEATAAIDVETDRVLQETIRTEFKHRTILTIAHRLHTIMDSDRVAVLDQGKVAEFDTPESLLQQRNSLFYLLCKEGGFVEDTTGEP